MRLTLLAAVALALGLTACGGTAGAHHLPPAATAQAPPATATAPAANPDAHACWAFHRAITKGVPASAAGEDTMTWLQSQMGNASPEVQAALQRFIGAWGALNPGKIARAQRAVKGLCAALG